MTARFSPLAGTRLQLPCAGSLDSICDNCDHEGGLRYMRQVRRIKGVRRRGVDGVCSYSFATARNPNVGFPFTRQAVDIGVIMLGSRLAVLCMLLCVLTTSFAWFQEHVEIGSSSSCENCTIELVPLAVLRSPRDSFSLSRLSGAVRDSEGRMYVAPILDPGKILVYDAAGEYARSIGRQGPGPRELGHIDRLTVGHGDTLYVYHRRRFSVFSPSHEFVRTGPLPGRVRSAVFMPGGEHVVAAHVTTRNQIGYPLHILAEDTVHLSFGSSNPSVGRYDNLLALSTGTCQRF